MGKQPRGASSIPPLKTNQSDFANSVEQAPVGIAILRGRDFVADSANRKYLELVDKSAAEFIGLPLFESLPEVRSVVEPLLNRVLDLGEPFFADELAVMLNRFGKQEQGYFNLVYQPLRDGDGQVNSIMVVATEVTEQVIAKNALAQSESEFRNMVLYSPIAMTIFKGRDLIIDIANETLLKNIWGRTWEQVKGKSVLEVFPELLEQKFPALLQSVFDSGLTYRELESEAIVNGPHGLKRHYLDFEYAPLKDPIGSVFAIMVTVNDVTEKVETRQAIKESADRLRLATEGTQLGTWDLDLRTRKIIHSPRLASIFGYPESELLTHPQLRSHIHPDDVHTIVEPAFEKAMQNGVYFYESRITHPDASIHWIRTRGKVYFDDSGTPSRMVGTMISIDEQKLAQRQLEENEARLQLVIDASELGTWELDLNTDKVIYSKRYLEIFGFNANAEISHADFLKLLDPSFRPLRNQAFENALKTGVFFYEAQIKWVDGSDHWIEVRGRLLYDDLSTPVKMIGTLRDITEEKTYKQKVEESERRFKSVADTAPVLIWMATPDRKRVFFNKAWLNYTGRSPGQDMGDGWIENIYPGDVDRYLDVYTSSFARQKEFYIEYRLRRKDGEYRWVSNNGVPRFTPEGIFEGFIGACMDIHDKILFEETLKESESRLRIAALSGELGTWSYNPQTRELVWDNQSRELLGVDADTPITVELLFSLMHPDDRESSRNGMLAAMDPDKAVIYDSEYRVLTNDPEKVRWIHAKGKAFFNSDRLPYLFSGTILDVTEKRRALDELQENEQKFRTLADSMPQFIWTADEKGVLNYFNLSVYNYSGLTPEQIAKEGWLQIVHPDDQEQNVLLWVQAIQSGDDFIFEHRFKRHDGVFRWQLSRAIPQRNPEGKIQSWVGTSTDIHDKKIFMDELEEQVSQRTQELKLTVEELRKSNNELEQFAYVASHDLQEPLRKIQTFATRILDIEADNMTPRGKDYMTRMQGSSRRMQQLILDLLAFSRTTTTEKHLELTDMNMLLEKVKDQLSDLIERNKVTIHSTILPDLNIIPYQIEQLLTNLIGNSIKFAKKDVLPVIHLNSGSIHGSQLVNPNANPETHYNFICLTDNGIGFDQQFSDRIFQVFQRLHGKEAYEGTGIGLAICKKIAENHNGFITAKSEPGSGAEFCFYIPG